MGYLNENGLARYDSLIKQWVTFKSGTVDGIDPLLNWQKTSTAGAVTFSPLPAAPIDPVVNFAFTETGPAEGTKGPDNPSTITGVESVKVGRCGKNLLIYPYIETSRTFTSGLTATTNADGLVTIDGTAPSLTAYFSVTDGEGGAAGNASSMALTVGETYTASLSLVGGTAASTSDIKLVIVDHEAGAVSATVAIGGSASFTATSSSFRARLEIKKDISFSNVTVAPQLELGTTATAFEPYDGADYTISLGGTFYGGSVDLSTGVMTVTHFCTNVSTFYQFTEARTDCILVRFRCDYYSKESSDSVSYVCDLFPSSRDTSDFEHVRQNNDSAISATLYLAKSRLDLSGAADPSSPTDAEWLAAANAWVAEHPFDFVSMLKNPYTVQLTPTQIYSLSQSDPYAPRLNTVYSDQTSVQVGYPKSPQATASELTNAIISLGGEI